MSLTAAFVTTLSLLVTDAKGHKAQKAIPQEGAEAIASACAKTRGAIPGSNAACAAVLVVQAFRESGYRLEAVGDGGRSHGPFQTHGIPRSWADAVAIYVPLLQWSASTCLEPLALVASGSCTNKAGIEISRARMAEAKRIATLAGSESQPQK